MPAEYLFEKVGETELMNESLGTILQGTSITSLAGSNDFLSYGDGIVDDHFYMGNLITRNLDNITINNLTSYVLSIPKNGAYSVKDTKTEERNIMGKSGALVLPTDKLIYDSSTEYVDDYVIILKQNTLNSILNRKYNISEIKSDMLALNLKSDQVQACFQFIESTLQMLRAFPDARNSELVKKNLQNIATFMLIDIIAESVDAKPLINLSPEKYLVAKAEEIIEAESEKLFTIQEVADRVFTSPRNLQRAFRKHSKYTPMEFLYNRKLHKARKVLLSNNNPFATVKEVAFNAGILDINRFSKNYLVLFNEYPKETLRKSHQ